MRIKQVRCEMPPTVAGLNGTVMNVGPKLWLEEHDDGIFARTPEKCHMIPWNQIHEVIYEYEAGDKRPGVPAATQPAPTGPGTPNKAPGGPALTVVPK